VIAAEIRDEIFAAARAHAPDRFLSALLAPASVRDDLVTLAGVLGEIERVPHIVTEPMIGEIRLQWWLDWLETVPSTSPQAAAPASGNPLADCLADTLTRCELPTNELNDAIEARVSELYADGFPATDAYHAHLAATETGPFRLTAALIAAATGLDSGSLGSPEVDAVLRAAGRAYGGCRQIAKLNGFAAHGHWPLPPAGTLAPADMLAPENADARRTAIVAERREIERAQRLMRAEWQALPAPVRKCISAALRPCALIGPYLRASQSDMTWQHLRTAEMLPVSRAWRLWTSSVTGRL